VIADPSELARRAYINASFCDIYPSGSAALQNCLHSVLDPTFRGIQPLIFMVQVMQGMVAMLAPVGIVAAAGCIATVVCGAALGTLLTIGDVGLSLYKYINGDVSLSDTLLHLGKVALETLLMVGIGKALSAGFKALKGLYVAFRAAKQAEAELEVVNLARLRLTGLLSCLRPGHSFAAGTPVLMADGDRRPIDQVTPGDRVLATDPATGRTAAKPVTNVWRHTDTALTDVGVTGPGGDGVVHTTATHRFWSASSQSWVAASRLSPGTGLAAPPGGGPATVTAVRAPTGARTMYDLTVADLHSYYVAAGGTPVLVHNSTAECPLVLGIKRYGEDLAGRIKGFTINNPALDKVVGNVNGVPITLWMQEVNKELSANGHIAVAMDGWELLGAGTLEEAKAAFLLAVRNGAGTSWRATEWEMYRISFYCRIGNLKWSNVKFYVDGKLVNLPEPIWNVDPTKVRFP